MIRIFTILTLALVAGFAATPAEAASNNNNVAVLYDGNTETNRETINFLRRELRSAGASYQLTFVQDAAAIQPGQYRGVVVLNTGMSSGVDPKLAAFLKSYSAKKEIVLVTLLKGSTDLTVSSLTAAQSTEGVDALTAASAWNERGPNKQIYVALHQKWVSQVAQFLNAR